MKDLLLLHGALGSKEQFEGITSLLSDSYNVHVFNFSGHGGRPVSRDFGNELFAENILDYLNTNEINRCSIFGYSMGGYAALYFAKNYPDKVNKVVTLATKFNWSTEAAQKEVKMLNPEKIQEKVPHFAKLLKERHAPEDWKKILLKTADMMLALGNGKAFTNDDFSAISCEALIAVGDADKMVSIQETENAANLIPHAKLSILNGVEHPIEKVDKQLLAQIIIDFI